MTVTEQAGDFRILDNFDVEIDDYDDDPVLLGPDGRPVETWREDYPYDRLMSRHEYESRKRTLQTSCSSCNAG